MNSDIVLRTHSMRLECSRSDYSAQKLAQSSVSASIAPEPGQAPARGSISDPLGALALYLIPFRQIVCATLHSRLQLR